MLLGSSFKSLCNSAKHAAGVCYGQKQGENKWFETNIIQNNKVNYPRSKLESQYCHRVLSETFTSSYRNCIEICGKLPKYNCANCCQICVTSRSLETLPETHSLALKATETNTCKGEGSESNGRLYETSALLPTIEDKYQIQHSKRSISSSGHISVQDIMPGVSSTDDLTRSESSRLNNQTGGSSTRCSCGRRRKQENLNSS